MPIDHSTVQAGKAGEQAALSLLQRKGYKILVTNFRTRFGEIDIVAQEENILVFVEVKTRWSRKFGLPEEAVTPQKIRSIIKASEYYKLIHPKTPELMRIDVVAIEVENQEITRCELIKNVTG